MRIDAYILHFRVAESSYSSVARMRIAPCCSPRAPRLMQSTSNTYLGLSEATRLVSSPMIVPRAASLDSLTGTPRAAPIRA